jgi:hypothetical protein
MKQKFSVHAILLLFLSVMLGPETVYSEDLDGTAAIALQGDLPETGFFAASNSFSRNTTVNVTNLENGKTTQVVITKGLDISGYGFLLTLSRDAASAIGIYGRDIVRVRVTLSTDSAAFSRYNDGRSFSGDPDYDPRAFIRSNSVPFSGSTLSQAPQSGQGTIYSGTEPVQPFHTYSALPDNNTSPGSSLSITTMPLSDALSLQSGMPPNVVSAPPSPVDPVIIVMPTVPQDLSAQGSGSSLAYSYGASPLSEPPVSSRVLSSPITRATATGPYKDPGETEIILRSPDLVINAPLPEMGPPRPSTGSAIVSSVETVPPSSSPPMGIVGDRSEVSSAPQVFYIRDPDDIRTDLPNPSVYLPEGESQGRGSAVVVPPVTGSGPDLPVTNPLSSEEEIKRDVTEPGYNAPGGGSAFSEQAQAAEPLVESVVERALLPPLEPIETTEYGLVNVPEYREPGIGSGTAWSDIPRGVPPESGRSTAEPAQSAASAEPSFVPADAGPLIMEPYPVRTDEAHPTAYLPFNEPDYVAPSRGIAVPVEIAEASDITEDYPTANTPVADPFEINRPMVVDEPAFADSSRSTAFSSPAEMARTGGSPAVNREVPRADAASAGFADDVQTVSDLAANEPGYQTEGTASVIAAGDRSFGVGGGEPLPSDNKTLDERMPLADAIAFAGEPIPSEGALIGEPGYRADEGSPFADVIPPFSEPIQSGDTSLNEPVAPRAGGIAYAGETYPPETSATGDTDLPETSAAGFTDDTLSGYATDEPGYAAPAEGGAGYAYPEEAGSSETLATGFADNADATALFGEPVTSGEPGLSEPGYVIGEGGAGYTEEADLPETLATGFADNADATTLFGEPVASGEPGLSEPGYRMLQDGTIVDAEGVPVTDETEFAEALALLTEPATSGGASLGEPGYTVSDESGVGYTYPEEADLPETLATGFADDADATTLFGEPVASGEPGLSEPGYRMLQDGTIVDAEGVPVTDETEFAEALALLTEPATSGGAGLGEPGSRVLKDVT